MGAFVTGDVAYFVGDELCSAPWGAGQPDNSGNEDCVIATRGLLFDVQCKNLNHFICKRTSSTAITDSVCQTLDSEYSPNSDNSSCYKIHKQPKKWSQAYAACKDEGSDLAVVNSQGEADYLVQLMKKVFNSTVTAPHLKNYLYVGFHDLFTEGEYLTIKGETLKQAGYSEWQKGQPDDHHGKEDCGCINGKGHFNDIDCENVLLFICERNIVNDANIVNLYARLSKNE
ncbi:Hemolymph lipopolysaccharide-binding protein [Eumeta japonica]|uniref:Hemolymph lipopolysaccharide-binding protein n=1 Tax=Eumeta variegata TaxID=151549 RepID=A0A4C1WU60_EUMVA|nr:Hemolymph lipopolysaccharide-binding protein [Eumeta japonica]